MHEPGILFQRDKVDAVALNDSYPLLTHHVLKYGQLTFCTDPKKEKEFEDKAIGEYLDWQPVLEEQTKTTFN